MDAIRNMYAKMGVDNFYETYGDAYENPHRATIGKLLTSVRDEAGTTILDLCCGAGEVTAHFPDRNVTGCDPYTYALYEKNMGRKALRYSFLDIAQGALAGCRFDTVICSFALHLCDESLLPQVLYQLALTSENLWIITPHKRPDIHVYWALTDEKMLDRVRLRRYRSLVAQAERGK